MALSYYQFWAKTDRQDPVKTYHLLPYHCLDVAAVGAAQALVEQGKIEGDEGCLSVKESSGCESYEQWLG